MKKIIEHGCKQRMETTCPECGCKFSYDWADVIQENIYEFNNTSYYSFPQYKIGCPECGHIFQILNWSFTYPIKCPNITWTCNTSICKGEENCNERKCKKEN